MPEVRARPEIDLCTRRVQYHVRDARNNVWYFVCERDACRAWAAAALLAARYVPLERLIPEADRGYYTTGCMAPRSGRRRTAATGVAASRQDVPPATGSEP